MTSQFLVSPTQADLDTGRFNEIKNKFTAEAALLQFLQRHVLKACCMNVCGS